MQKPDADGYVTITWPSKTIPHGGLFHTRRAEPSHQQQEFLKVLLEESKLDIMQRQKAPFKLREEAEKRPEPEFQMPLVRPRTSKRRSLSAIRESGIYDMDPYKPMKRGEDREKLKERLANTMAYGDTPEQMPPPPPRIPKPKPKLPTAKEQWHDLISQIRERVDWLSDMEVLGQAEPHREIIQEQIEEKVRALDALGIDSECSSVRSGFSTLRSREPSVTARSNGSGKSKISVKSGKSDHSQPPKGSQDKPKVVKGPARSRKEKNEENISSYGKFSPLQYTPRRRV